MITPRAALLVLAALALPASVSATRAAQAATAQVGEATEDERFAVLVESDAERQDELDPLGALYRGENVTADDLALLFTDTLDRRRLQATRETLDQLTAIDRSRISADAQVSLDVLRAARREQADWLRPDIRALTAVRPFNHFNGFHADFPSVMARHGAIEYADVDDYRRALGLGSAFPLVIDNAIVRFRQGMASGISESRLTTELMIAQIDALLAVPIEKSPFYSPVLDFPDTVPRSARGRLREEFSHMTSGRIYPAYQRLRTFLAEEYLPAARLQPGLSAMNGGRSLYRRLIERETTLPLDPDEVHRTGLAEVARIRAEMETVKRELGGTGTLETFFEELRTDPRFHPRSARDLAEGFEAVRQRVDHQIPRFFTRRPRTPLTLAPYPPWRERYEPGGSYQQGSPDGERPGTFFYNTHDLPNRFLTGMATLYLHEGSPGHHFQISLAQENEALPPFQRFSGSNAFIEGWALYAETLGYEMGLYNDPMQLWGTLDDEMLRAMRLVVDTGIHDKGWSRDQAIAYMLANSGMSAADAAGEVDRYIANPGQALSYKIGAMTIQRLRRQAEAALGKRFDIRTFHDEVLAAGATPLPILEARIARWIAQQRARP